MVLREVGQAPRRCPAGAAGVTEAARCRERGLMGSGTIGVV